MFKRTIIYFSIPIFLFSFAGQVYAYDEETTHPALTQEIVEFYNLLHPEQKLTEEEKELIISGSTKEDEWPRWINHFYDPVNKVGWIGEKQGNVPSYILRIFSNFVVSTEGARSAVDWINNSLIQESYARYSGNRTWKKGLEYFATGNLKEAYVTLGHALHLLEDMSVPEHTRNDTHAPLKEATGDEGSPFENYLMMTQTRKSIRSLNLPKKLFDLKANVPSFSTIEDYLVNLAAYSNKYFFSKDTINDPKYEFPKIVREDGNYGYGIDENGNELPIAKIVYRNIDKINVKKDYVLRKSDEPILSAYFFRLATKTILYGAGVIELFKKQAAEEIVKREYPVRLVKYDFSFLTPKTFSLAAESKKLFLAAKTLLANVAETTSAVFENLVSSAGNKTELAAETLSLDKPPAAPEPAANRMVINQAPVVEQATVASLPAVQSATVKPAAVNNSVGVSPTPASNIPSVSVVSLSVYSSPTAVVSAAASEELSDNIISTSTATSTATSNATTAASTSTSANSITSSTVTSTVFLIPSTNPEQTTPTATSVPATSLILISEVYPDKTGNNYDFVELYNRATSSIDLSAFSLSILRSGATTSESLAVFGGEDIIQIPANGFFLVGFDNYSSSGFRKADLFRSSRFLPTTKPAKIILRANGENVDEFEYNPSLLAVGNSFERRAVSDNECVSSQNDGEFLGNGCNEYHDSNGNGNTSNFEIRKLANPQNSQNLPEPRNAPKVSNFSGSWSASTQEIILTWGKSVDVLGATSSIFYELEETNSGIIFSGTNTHQFIFPVEKAGLDYNFTLQAIDKDGLASNAESLTIATLLNESVGATQISEWKDPTTSFGVNIGFNSSPRLGIHLMATATYTGPGDFIVEKVAWSALDNSQNNHAPCCNFLFIVLKSQEGRHLATSSEGGPQFGSETTFANAILSPGTIIEYYVRDVQAGSNWTFSDFTFYQAQPKPPPLLLEPPILAYEPNDTNVAGPFSAGPSPGRIRLLFQFLGKGWSEGTTITSLELKYRAPDPWNISIVGAPECSYFDSPFFSLADMQNFTLETNFEANVLKIYKYTGSATLNSNKCYAMMAMFNNFTENNYIAGTANGLMARPDYVTDRDTCNSKDGSGGNIGACTYGGQDDYIIRAFFRLFSSN